MSAPKVTARVRNAVFLTALAVSTLLMVANFVILQVRAGAQQSVAAVVNVSGRQRMLSQRMALLARNLSLSEDLAERDAIRKELVEAIALFDRSHRGLTRGDPDMALPSDLPSSASEVYFDAPIMLDEQVRRYSTQLKSLVAMPDAELASENPVAQNVHAIAARGTLLSGLDAAVTAYQKDGEAMVAQLELLIWWVSGSTLAAVAVTFWLAFLTVRSEVGLRATLEERVQGRTQSLAEVNAELRRSNKDLEEFAHVVSHDMKAPLRAISSLAHWIAEDYRETLDDQGRESLQLLVGSSERMSDMIDGILRYSRAGRQRRDLVPGQSGELVQEVINLLRPPKNVTVRAAGELPRAIYDRTQLEQVFQNLISSAIEHHDKPNGEVVVSCRDAGAAWEFCVRDDGPGIPAQHFERIFELFQTLKRRDELDANGVGLSLTKRIIERHGGSVYVESSVGEGSQFRFTAPKEPKFVETNTQLRYRSAEMPHSCPAKRIHYLERGSGCLACPRSSGLSFPSSRLGEPAASGRLARHFLSVRIG